MSSANSDIFYFFFSNLDSFFFFSSSSSSSLIAVAWIPKTVLNSSGESEHPCLIPGLKQTHGFAHLSKMPDLFRVAS